MNERKMNYVNFFAYTHGRQKKKNRIFNYESKKNVPEGKNDLDVDVNW